MSGPAKVLIIGNYPPPMCGWAMQTKLVVEELRRRGHACEVLKINQGRQIPGTDYMDVQNGLDYLRKVWRFARCGYRLNVHLNGMGRKGYLLALAAVVTGRLADQPARVTFHGGLEQNNFPRDSGLWRAAFELLFRLAEAVACDDLAIKQAIENYGIPPEKVQAIPTFSLQYVDFQPAILGTDIELFLKQHHPIVFCYVAFRPEYRLEVVREAMKLFRARHPNAGFIWLGFPGKEFSAAQEFVRAWPAKERDGLLLLGNLAHDGFLTLLSRSSIFLRTPACDGVCASVLESLALGIPVVASENQRRPAGVVTYGENHAADMCARLVYVSEHYDEVRGRIRPAPGEDNVNTMAGWLTGEAGVKTALQAVSVRS